MDLGVVDRRSSLLHGTVPPPSYTETVVTNRVVVVYIDKILQNQTVQQDGALRESLEIKALDLAVQSPDAFLGSQDLQFFNLLQNLVDQQGRILDVVRRNLIRPYSAAVVSSPESFPPPNRLRVVQTSGSSHTEDIAEYTYGGPSSVLTLMLFP